MRLALVVEYDGTGYRGFQYQANAPSIQEELERAIAGLTGETVRIKGAGRTDAGVHARGQVVAFDTESQHLTDVWVRALNAKLADDVAVTAAYRVDREFDPRRQALRRTYVYTIVNRPTPSPLWRRKAHLVRGELDAERMDRAARCLAGTRDFRRFCGPLEDRGGSTVRSLYEASVTRSGERVTFTVAASSFLPHQVRRMAGALVDVGQGRLSLSDFKLMVKGEDTSAVSKALPPQGLCLMAVTYADFPPHGGGADDDQH